MQQLYGVADSIIVGKILGAQALAAIGASGSFSFFVLGFCAGLCNGFAVLIAQCFGARDETELRRYFANSILLCAIAAIFFTTMTLIFCNDIMRLMKTPENIIVDSCKYVKVIFAGIPAIFMYNILSGTIRSLGDSKSPLMFLALKSLLNIILDVVFIAGFKTGVAGAGFATIISQGISGFTCLIYILRKLPILKVRKEEWRINPAYIKKMCVVGLPAGLQTSVIAVGTIILQAAINGLGTVYVAAVAFVCEC